MAFDAHAVRIRRIELVGTIVGFNLGYAITLSLQFLDYFGHGKPLGRDGRKNSRLYYQVVLGTIELDAAVASLVTKFGDTRPERAGARGEAILATIMLGRNGKPIEEPEVSISSFAWGVPKALRGDPYNFSDWQIAEVALVEKLDRLIRREDKEGELLPLDQQAIERAYRWAVSELELPSDLVEPPRFAIRSYRYYRNSDPPEPLLLNSFFLNDLAAARTLFREGKAPPNLRKYLGVDKPGKRINLLDDYEARGQAVAPKSFSLRVGPVLGAISLSCFSRQQ